MENHILTCLSTLPIMRNCVDSFDASEFKPPGGVFGFLYSNKHWQTIIGSEALTDAWCNTPYPRDFVTKRERLQTPDDDFYDIDWVNIEMESLKGIVVILHGMEANTKGPLVSKMTTAFLSKGFSCCLVSFRGCSGEENRQLKAYHIGFTQDLDQVCRLIHERYPDSPVYLSGFSLGGAVTLKYLGEIGSEAKALGIHGATVISVPFDPTSTTKQIDSGFNRVAYSASFLREFKSKAERQAVKFPGVFDIEKVRKCKTLHDLDEHYFAPIYGYVDKNEFHARNVTTQYLKDICVPTMVINSLDDPFIDLTTIPTAEDIGPTAPVRLIFHKKGGHCGFYSAPHPDVPKHGWLAEEISRAIRHIHDSAFPPASTTTDSIDISVDGIIDEVTAAISSPKI